MKVFAICGSTRKQSTNLQYIEAVKEMSKDRFEVEIFSALEEIAAFNPDIEEAPEPVNRFRNKIRESDGVLICTPEYAMGVPGSLKNAIDWTVGTADFSHKPVALITASTLGNKGHLALMETLRIIEAIPATPDQLVISHAKTKITANNTITDTDTRQAIQHLIDGFYEKMKNPATIPQY